MAIFGYIVYLIMTIWVTLIGVAVWCWPSGNGDAKAEGWGVAVVIALMYYGAYKWFPLTVGVA